MSLGTKLDRASSFALLDRFVGAGHSLIDTANNYAFWVDGGTGDESETVIGQWMRSRGTRADVVLAWMIRGRNRIVPLVAASSLDQLNENLGAADLVLSDEEVRAVGWWG